MGWNIFGGIGQVLSTAYHDTEKALYDVTRGAETLGYEVGTAVKTGHFIPLKTAYKRVGQIHENVPILGNVSGRKFAKIGASYGTQALPFIGTFGHLASHPKENAFQKGSDIAFGIADVVPFAGDVISAFKKPIEEGIEGVADVIQRNLRTISSPIKTGNNVLDVFGNKLLKTGLRRTLGIISDLHSPNVERLIHVGTPVHLPRLPEPLPIPIRIKNFIKSVSKDIKFITPIDRLPPKISGILDDVAKTIRSDLHTVGVAIDEDPVHILAHDINGVLHDIAITKEGRILHYVEDTLGGGVRKIGEDIISGGEDLFKTIRNEVDHIIPFHIKLANFLKSGKLLAGLGGLGIGLSVAGGLTTPTSTTTTSTTSTTTQSTGGYTGSGGLGTGGFGGGFGYSGGSGGGSGGYTGGGVLGQMNAGNVLQSQLQSLSAMSTTPTQETTPTVETTPQEETTPTPIETSNTTSPTSIFSNKFLILGIIVVIIIIIIIAIMR